ncbi:spermidine synthase [Halosimplex litoreum]|uniref:Spermidine synthase n=1 Tax=Halosimplex litoreum TaxID=1198301 RepID=A0A7T3G131_9EURY|nr:spermidine synthase [Halosimplex litoreum]QPV64431.1 spermidine synthase [Halosimplex litoreum]
MVRDSDDDAGRADAPPGRSADDEPSLSSGPRLTDRRLLLGLTFVVAFCSIAYELVYSELLTVFYGGTVLRYSITIGLYLFSMGVGSFLSAHLDDPAGNFLRTEVYLALAGPAGAGFMIALNAFPDVTLTVGRLALKEPLTLGLAHVPILVVGVLSGFEIPLLNELVEHREETLFAALGGVYPRRVVRGVLGVFFSVSEAEGRSFSEVLGVDYLGGLAGTVVYALVLYPRYGLVVSVLVLGLLNGLAALAFAAWSARAPAARGADRSFSLARWRGVVLAGLLLTGTYGGLVANAGVVDRTVTGAYMGDRIESEYQPGKAEVTVTGFERTRYQRITTYRRDVAGDPGTETCLRLDGAIQLCESWVDSYHAGLVDVPLSAYVDRSGTVRASPGSDGRASDVARTGSDGTDTARTDPETAGNASFDVLLVGGGDYIAVDRLRDYEVSVDQVDIDGEFLAYSRNESRFARYNDDAFEYDRLNTTVGDAYNYLRGTERRYDLVLLDVPGARSDDALSLYSTEFYRLLRGHLTDRGVVATWAYSKYWFPQHHKVYVETVREAGFDRYLPYSVYEDPDGDDELERGERFYLLSDGPAPKPNVSRARSDYLDAVADRFERLDWRPIPAYRGVEPNSVFDPNYDVIVDP